VTQELPEFYAYFCCGKIVEKKKFLIESLHGEQFPSGNFISVGTTSAVLEYEVSIA
jgi:hypothetical protein